jgi:hypothetical protein
MIRRSFSLTFLAGNRRSTSIPWCRLTSSTPNIRPDGKHSQRDYTIFNRFVKRKMDICIHAKTVQRSRSGARPPFLEWITCIDNDQTAKEKCSNYQIVETLKPTTDNAPDQPRFPNSLRERELKELKFFVQILAFKPHRPFHQHSAPTNNDSCSSKITFR